MTKKEFNSEDFQTPEFEIEVKTSFSEDKPIKVQAYNVGRGFVLETPSITPVLCNDLSKLDIAVDTVISKLEYAMTN